MVDKDKEFKGTRGCKQESRIKKSNLARQSRVVVWKTSGLRVEK